MVVILQQTTDNGKRFVSTVVEEEVSLMSSSSGLSSQHSVTERSAIYKQRIDSLFGYPKPPSNGTQQVAMPGGIGMRKVPGVSKIETGNTRKMDLVQSSEDEGYQRIDEEMEPSLPSDSLNEKVNVSKVSLNFQDSFTPNTKPYLATSNGIRTQPLSWKNRTYCNTTHFVTNLQRDDNEAHHVGQVEGPSSSSGIIQFPVEYLGSVPVQGITTTLQDLQLPLRSLYINFLRRKNVTPGQLSIVGEGLRFEAPKIRLVNPFHMISVWAAIKFVARGDPVPSECAFMPLISDPEGQDKRRLFGKMDPELGRIYLNSITRSGGNGFRNPPIFACVTRENTLSHYSSNCHAFTCKSAEDAIVVAANLYQYLLVNELKIQKEGESGYGSLTRSPPIGHMESPSDTNGGSHEKRLFSSSSVLSPTDDTSYCASISFNTSGPDHHATPVRPPRRNKKQTSGDVNSDETLTMPRQRRKSFKVTCNRFQRPNPTKVKKKVKISAPDETAAEVALHESIDKILDRIVHPGGMSLDDLKPSYKKLIIRLALTLTQGQLQNKNKGTLKRPSQRFRLRRNEVARDDSEERPRLTGNFLKPFPRTAASGKTGSFDKKVRTGKTHLNPLVSGNKPKSHKMIPRTCTEEEHLLSICSGCICDNCSEKCYCSLPMKQNLKIVGSPPVTSSASSTKGEWVGGQAQNKSAKKLEPVLVTSRKKVCGYDTESCADSEKCYCSLKGVKSNGLKVYNINLDTETSDTDTNSYDLESFNQKNGISKKQTNFSPSKPDSPATIKMLSYNQEKRHTYACSAASSAVLDIHETNVNAHHLENNQNGRPSQQTKDSRQLTSNSELGHVDRSSPSLRQRKKVLLITGSNSSTQLVYDGRPPNFAGNSSLGRGHLHEDISEDEGVNIRGESSKLDMEDSLNSLHVLDMKKTAEIEAMFTTLKVDENMKCLNEELTRHRRFINSGKVNGQTNSSIDFQTSLGYLP